MPGMIDIYSDPNQLATMGGLDSFAPGSDSFGSSSTVGGLGAMSPNQMASKFAEQAFETNPARAEVLAKRQALQEAIQRVAAAQNYQAPGIPGITGYTTGLVTGTIGEPGFAKANVGMQNELLARNARAVDAAKTLEEGAKLGNSENQQDIENSLKYGDLAQRTAMAAALMPLKTNEIVKGVDGNFYKVNKATGEMTAIGANGANGASAMPQNFGFEPHQNLTPVTIKTMEASEDKARTADNDKMQFIDNAIHTAGQLLPIYQDENTPQGGGIGTDISTKYSQVVGSVNPESKNAQSFTNAKTADALEGDLVRNMTSAQQVPGGRMTNMNLGLAINSKPNRVNNDSATNVSILSNGLDELYTKKLKSIASDIYASTNPQGNFSHETDVNNIVQALKKQYPITVTDPQTHRITLNPDSPFIKDSPAEATNVITDAIANPQKYGVPTRKANGVTANSAPSSAAAPGAEAKTSSSSAPNILQSLPEGSQLIGVDPKTGQKRYKLPDGRIAKWVGE